MYCFFDGNPASVTCPHCGRNLCSDHSVPSAKNGKYDGKYVCQEYRDEEAQSIREREQAQQEVARQKQKEEEARRLAAEAKLAEEERLKRDYGCKLCHRVVMSAASRNRWCEGSCGRIGCDDCVTRRDLVPRTTVRTGILWNTTTSVVPDVKNKHSKYLCQQCYDNHPHRASETPYDDRYDPYHNSWS